MGSPLIGWMSLHITPAPFFIIIIHKYGEAAEASVLLYTYPPCHSRHAISFSSLFAFISYSAELYLFLIAVYIYIPSVIYWSYYGLIIYYILRILYLSGGFDMYCLS